MKPVFLFYCFVALILANGCFAQEIDYNKIILPRNVKEMSNEEKLVQIAWQNNPTNLILTRTMEISKVEKKISNWAWLDYLTIRSNINEFTINPPDDPAYVNTFYPRYNFSFILPLGSLGQNALVTKQRKMQIDVAQGRINSQKLQMRSEILTLYTKYQLVREKFILQKDIEQEILANFRLVEENFKKGAETVTAYNAIMERYTTQRIRTIEAQAEVRLLKIQIEEIIGVSLESVISN